MIYSDHSNGGIRNTPDNFLAEFQPNNKSDKSEYSSSRSSFMADNLISIYKNVRNLPEIEKQKNEKQSDIILNLQFNHGKIDVGVNKRNSSIKLTKKAYSLKTITLNSPFKKNVNYRQYRRTIKSVQLKNRGNRIKVKRNSSEPKLLKKKQIKNTQSPKPFNNSKLMLHTKSIIKNPKNRINIIKASK